MIAWIIVTIDGGTFVTVDNIVGMFQRSVALGIVAAGQTVVILAGSLDLSVAYVISPRVADGRRDDGRPDVQHHPRDPAGARHAA